MMLFRHNLPQPTQAQLMRGEFPETLYIQSVRQVQKSRLKVALLFATAGNLKMNLVTYRILLNFRQLVTLRIQAYPPISIAFAPLSC